MKDSRAPKNKIKYFLWYYEEELVWLYAALIVLTPLIIAYLLSDN
jgi:hypothetical protein